MTQSDLAKKDREIASIREQIVQLQWQIEVEQAATAATDGEYTELVELRDARIREMLAVRKDGEHSHQNAWLAQLAGQEPDPAGAAWLRRLEAAGEAYHQVNVRWEECDTARKVADTRIGRLRQQLWHWREYRLDLAQREREHMAATREKASLGWLTVIARRVGIDV